MKDFIVNLKERFDFKFYPVTILPLIALILTYPAIKWLPVQYTYENSLLENLQLIILLISFIVCIKSKIDKKFFISLALVCIILFFREVNFGRTIFFPIEGMENAFYSWKDIPYGYLAEPIEGLFIFCSGLYFLFTKSYKVLWNYILNAKISIYNWIFLFLGIIFGTMGEKIGNFALEEMMEMLFYLSFCILIYLQSQKEKYIEAVR